MNHLAGSDAAIFREPPAALRRNRAPKLIRQVAGRSNKNIVFVLVPKPISSKPEPSNRTLEQIEPKQTQRKTPAPNRNQPDVFVL